MFRKLLLATALALSTSQALAQNPTCPTRPVGDNSNSCASTAFVQAAVSAATTSVSVTCPGGQFVNVISGSGSTCAAPAGVGITIGTTTITSGTTTRLLYDLAGVVQESPVLTLTAGGPLNINPTVATINQGITITQSGPNTTPTGPINYNSVNITNPTSVTLPASLTNGMSNNAVHGSLIEMNDTGVSSITSALTAHYVANSGTPNGDKIALHGNAYSNKTMTAYLLGLDAVAAVDSAANIGFLTGAQIEVGMYNSGTATNRMGVEISADTAGQGSNFDAAIAIDNLATPGGPWKKGISFGSVSSIGPTIDSGGDAIFANSANTITNFCNCSNFTVTGKIFDFPNFSVTNTNNQNATAQVLLTDTNVGTSAFAQYAAQNASGTMTAGVGGANALPALYTNRAYVTGNSLAMIAGTNSTQPFIQIVNNAEVGRWSSATPGELDLGVTGATVGKLCFFNATSGSDCISPPTGALGSIAITWPSTSGTLLTTTNSVGTITSITNSLSGDVAMNNVANYFDGPSVAQGTSGTWFASGTVTLTDTGVTPVISCKLWDGTTVIASTNTGAFGAGGSVESQSLSGVLTTPAANIRISCKDTAATTGKILFNQSGNSKDSTVTAIRIN